MKAAAQTLAAIAAFEAHYGRRFLFRDAHLPVWDAALRDREPRAVAQAVDLVVRQHAHGAAGLAELRQALDGVWRAVRYPRTDAHGQVQPHLGTVRLHVLLEFGTERVVRAFDERGNLVDPQSQRVLQSASAVPAELRPPAGHLPVDAELPRSPSPMPALDVGADLDARWGGTRG